MHRLLAPILSVLALAPCGLAHANTTKPLVRMARSSTGHYFQHHGDHLTVSPSGQSRWGTGTQHGVVTSTAAFTNEHTGAHLHYATGTVTALGGPTLSERAQRNLDNVARSSELAPIRRQLNAQLEAKQDIVRGFSITKRFVHEGELVTEVRAQGRHGAATQQVTEKLPPEALFRAIAEANGINLVSPDKLRVTRTALPNGRERVEVSGTAVYHPGYPGATPDVGGMSLKTEALSWEQAAGT